MALTPSNAFMLMMATSVLVAFMLLVAWSRDTRLKAYLWWAGGFALGAVGMAVVASDVHGHMAFGSGILVLALGICWAGARSFDNRPIHAWPLAVGLLIWASMAIVPAFANSTSARAALLSFVVASYSLAIAGEFWRGRGERLASRIPLALLCGLNGVVHLGRMGLVLAGFDTPTNELLTATMLFQPALILIAGGLYGVSLGRDRLEAELRRNATVDSLTGVLNRGALIAQAEDALKDARSRGQGLALLLFDLDRFKDINDTMGHQAGDLVLQSFARVAGRSMRGRDLFGRIGGEEFAAVLPGLGPAGAQVIAERVRREFARCRIEHQGIIVPSTVSVGMVALGQSDVALDELLSLADRALYDAKRGGRDQVRNALALTG